MLKDKLGILKKRPTRLMCEENQYEKLNLIGQGTFGKVYLVVNKKNYKKFALKEVTQDSKYKNRQLSIIAQIEHPNIIEMKDYYFKIVNNQCILHILMEYMDQSLHSRLKMQRKIKQPIDLRIRKLIAFQLFKGLYYLDLNNVCHRDLKPPNILLNSKTHQLKICDFGSAKIIETKENNVSYICSRYYRAPELILSSTSYGCQIDMWSAGCIIVELMTLEPVFPGDSSVQQLIEIIKILGSPTKEQMLLFNVENEHIEIPKIKGTEWQKVLKRYHPEQQELDLIKKILTYDADKRLKPQQALKHPYFSDLVSFVQIEKLPNLLQFDSLRNKKNKKIITELYQLYESYREHLESQKENAGYTANTTFERKTSLEN